MADPRPPRPGVDGLADRIRDLEREVERLRSPSGTQLGGTTGQTEAAIAYLNGLRSYGSTGVTFVTLTNVDADGVIKWYALSADLAQRHAIGPIEVPTGRLIVQASMGEASMTPADGFMIAYISFRVNDADGKQIVGIGTHTGRAYFNQRIGIGITTGPVGVTIPASFRGPFTITPVVGIWGQNTGSGQKVSCTYNTPSLRAEIIGNGL